jgi:predicted transcriptional regulator
MARIAQDVTDAELSVLMALWDMGTATVRDLAARIYAGNTNSTNATVQKLLKRLIAKRHVECNRTTWPHNYSAILSREEFVVRSFQATADKLCGGQWQQVFSTLFEQCQNRKAAKR